MAERNVERIVTKEGEMTGAKKVRRIIQRTSNALLMLVLLCSCNGTSFHSFRYVGRGWHRDSVAVFVYNGSHQGSCAMNVEARTTVEYRYMNLIVCAEYMNICDSLLNVDTISLAVFSDKGERLGATAGMLYQHSSEVKYVNFVPGDSIKVRINHIMPDEVLQGVNDVGIRIMDIN